MVVSIDEFNVLQSTVPPRVFIDNLNLAEIGVPTDPLPDPPTIVSLTPLDGAAVLTLTAPVFLGTGTFVAYRITAGTLVYVTTNTSLTLVGLPNNNPLTVAVTTETDVASSAAATATVTPATPPAGGTLPDAPTALVVTPFDGALALSWTAPGSFGSSAFSDYLVRATTVAMPATYYYPTTSTSAVIGNLDNDIVWDLTVVARTGAGASPGLAGTGTPTATAGAATSPALPYTTIPLTPTPGPNPTTPVGYIAPQPEPPDQLPEDLPLEPVFVPQPSIMAFYPEGVADSAGYFNPSNWAGL